MSTTPHNLTSSNRKDSSRNSNFQFYNKPTSFNGTKKFNTDREDSVKILGLPNPTGVQTFDERNRKVLFKKSHSKSIKLDLRNVILTNSQSTMGQFCNPKFVGNIYKAKKIMRFQSNEVKILITHNT